MNEQLDLSIIVPAFNEEQRLPATIRALRRYMDETDMTMEVLLVDDGSRDRTRDIIRAATSKDGRFVPIVHDRNRGKGAAVRDGLLAAVGRTALFLDADLAYGLEPVMAARSRIDAGADLAIGARDLARTDSRSLYSPVRRAASRVLHSLVQGVVNLDVPDTQCGFKAMRRDVGREMAICMTVQGFAFDVELLLLAHLWSLRVDRIPVQMTAGHGSSVKLLADSLRMAKDVAKIRLNAISGAYPPRPEHL